MTTFTQKNKQDVRHKSLFYAVELLTTNRKQSCCVERSYVRKARDYFLDLDDCQERSEALKIDVNYIKSWETLHDSCVGDKRPEDLIVCYLSGPEPQNDFEELISLGILPQNIWAFENNEVTYDLALQNYNSNTFPQPKIVKGSIEQYFMCTPKKFDIIYIDACGSIASDKKSLRIIATMCKYHRLNSPGIIITNFACPDLSKSDQLEEYSELAAEYLFLKENPNESIRFIDSEIVSTSFNSFKKKIKEDFHSYYSKLITASIIDIAALAVPIQRFVNSYSIKNILKNTPLIDLSGINFNDVNDIKNNSLYKFFYLSEILTNGEKSIKYNRTKNFIKEFSGLETYPKNIFESLKIMHHLKSNPLVLKEDIAFIKEYFDKGQSMYQFLDRPNSNLLFDLIVNQFAYPLHYNSNAIRRYKYQAKEMIMFTDVIVLDECRYIYEWLPTVHQIKNAFSNFSWQYVFRFALDGLVKQRIKYNNEYFFQGSVIPQNIEGFESKTITKRQFIK